MRRRIHKIDEVSRLVPISAADMTLALLQGQTICDGNGYIACGHDERVTCYYRIEGKGYGGYWRYEYTGKDA
jgi:hypothetical protein